jgi:hypothetical protein
MATYSIETNDGIIIDNIPASIPRDADVLKQRVAAERARRRMSSPEMQAKIEAQRARDREELDPTRGMSWGQKALVNLGAGFDQAITGVRQLGTDMFGSEQDSARMRAEVEEKRRINRDLASKTTGGSVLQFAGEVAPTLLIPGGAVAANTGRLGLAASGAAAGALGGAITPVGEGSESRGRNMALQGTIGAALPVTLGLAGDATRTLFRPSARAARAVEEGIVEPGMSAAQRRTVLQQTRDAVAQDVQQRAALRAAPTAAPAGATAAAAVPDDIPLSVAARLNNPEIARLERGSRTRNAANWYDFDLSRARAVADRVRQATEEGAEQGTRYATRRTNWDTNWADASANANLANFAGQMDRLPGELERLALEPSASNPAVRGAIDYVRRELDRLGDQITPAHIQQMRAELNGRVNPVALNNPMKQAPRDAPATLGLMRQLDTLLDDVTGGRFTQRVNAGYAADSRALDAARGANKVRGQYWEVDPNNFSLGRVQGTAADLDVPAITEFNLGSALNRARNPNGSTMLAPQAQQNLEAVLDALRRQNIVQRVAKSATGGGGSNTASDIIAARAAGAAGDIASNVVGGPAVNVASGILRGIRENTVGRSDRLLAEALQNPEQMLQLLERAAASRQGGALSLQESEVLNLLRRLRGQP